MDKKSLKVKIFFNLFGTYKGVRQVADITTTAFDHFILPSLNFTKFKKKNKFSEHFILVNSYKYVFQNIRFCQTPNYEKDWNHH